MSRSCTAANFFAATSYPDSSFTLRTAAKLGESPTSAQPPGSVHNPSDRSLTNKTRSPSNTADRISIFGVAYPLLPQEYGKGHRFDSGSGSQHLRRNRPQVAIPLLVKWIRAVRESVLGQRRHPPSPNQPLRILPGPILPATHIESNTNWQRQSRLSLLEGRPGQPFARRGRPPDWS